MPKAVQGASHHIKGNGRCWFGFLDIVSNESINQSYTHKLVCSATKISCVVED